jgi:hypothetical protein
MYFTGQTLVHKEKRFLARLATKEDGTFAWNILGNGTPFVLEDGTKITDKVSNYTHVEDEFGHPYAQCPKKGQFVDESAKKYLVSVAELKKMRQTSLRKNLIKAKELEILILKEMKICKEAKGSGQNHDAYYSKLAKGVTYWSNRLNNKYFNFTEWFLKRRKAKILFFVLRGWNYSRFKPQTYVFEYAGKTWGCLNSWDCHEFNRIKLNK